MTPEYAAKWRTIGESLGLSSGTLDIIDNDCQRNYHESEACCTEMWARWLGVDIDASWDKVILAIDVAELPLPPEVLSIVKEMYTKKHYEVSEDDWPPCKPEAYTTVALIHHEEKRAYEKAVIAVAKKTYEGKVMSPHTTTNGSKNEAKYLPSQMEDSYLSSCKYI